MAGEIGRPAPPVRHSGDSRWITATVALFAICVFAVSGAQIVPEVITSHGAAHAIRPHLVATFLLNIALVLFAWRRSEQLKKTFAERDAAEGLAYQLAYYDEVTGLLNRRRLNELLADLPSKSGQAALILIDLDHFKRVNDLKGHAAGDKVLAETARRLLEVCPATARCIRLGGDEFAVLLRGPAPQPEDAEQLAELLLQALNRPMAIADMTIVVGCSIGISFIDRDRRGATGLLERADLAMYEAKKRGRNCCVAFDERMEAEFERRKRFEAEMRQGIERGEFVPFFQPIVDLDTGELTGFEVLARWMHPARGVLEPAQFLELAEATGMISDLGYGVMHQALATARAWPSHLKMAVNISQSQFSDPGFAKRILQVLADTRFPAARLELEITEKSLLDDFNSALAIIASLKNNGISVSVDDFGMGYASLAELRALPFDRLKIDRRFIASFLEDRGRVAFVEAIATLGKGLKVPITAEGVEAESLRAKLLELGCCDAQGWVFARALSANEVDLGFGRDWAKPASAALADPSARSATGS